MANDKDALDLREYQLAERVEDRVSKKLFRLYGAIGSAVLATLGYLGWDILGDYRDYLKNVLPEQARTEMNTVVADTTKSIVAARKAIDRQLTALEILGDNVTRTTRRVDDQLVSFAPKAQALGELTNKVDNLELRRREIEVTLERTNLASASFEAITAQLGRLAEQVDALSALVQTADGGAEHAQTAALGRIGEQVKAVIQDARATNTEVAQVRTRPTVYFQFATAPRERAEAFSKALATEGYILPGADREVGAENKAEVRYFHAEDAAAADKLATDVRTVLGTLGYEPRRIMTTPLLEYQGKKPKGGVLELWLDLPAS